MSIGAQLRASREARGLSIDAIARTTRVQPRILAAIERDDVAAVPPRPFGRGFVRAYAREMGLDADQTARDYFAQFASTVPQTAREAARDGRSPAPAASRWPMVVISLGVLTGIGLALLASRPVDTNGQHPAAAPAVGTSGGSAGAAAAPADAPAATPKAAAIPPAAAPAAPPAAPLTIVLTAERPSWVTADADGRRALYTTILPGSPRTVAARSEIVIRVGDAGALAWQINGRDAGTMGRPGQIRDVRITPATAATVR